MHVVEYYVLKYSNVLSLEIVQHNGCSICIQLIDKLTQIDYDDYGDDYGDDDLNI